MMMMLGAGARPPLTSGKLFVQAQFIFPVTSLSLLRLCSGELMSCGMQPVTNTFEGVRMLSGMHDDHQQCVITYSSLHFGSKPSRGSMASMVDVYHFGMLWELY